jgi:hypothetical protein
VTNNNPLKLTLLDIYSELTKSGLSFLLGGGYGLFLKQTQRGKFNRTLIDSQYWPLPRSTDDLDLFLGAEILVNASHMDKVRTCIDNSGFIELEQAKYFQFKNSLGVKIDLLTGPVPECDRQLVQIRSHRARAKSQSLHLHAYYTQEVVGLDDEPYQIWIEGETSKGEACAATINIPNSFTYLILKLHALRDQQEDDTKEMGQHHALDIFRILAMLDSDEYKRCRSIANKYRCADAAGHASHIARTLFADKTSVGSLRLREHPLYKMDEVLVTFLKEIHEFFEDIPPRETET